MATTTSVFVETTLLCLNELNTTTRARHRLALSIIELEDSVLLLVEVTSGERVHLIFVESFQSKLLQIFDCFEFAIEVREQFSHSRLDLRIDLLR